MSKPDSSISDVPVDSPDHRRLPVLLRRSWYGLNQAFRRRIIHTGLTPDQYTALRNLQEAGTGGLTQSQLTGKMSSDPNTIASLVTRMVKGKLLTRLPDPRDRRAYRLRISGTGRRKYNEIRRVALGLQDEVMRVLPEADHEAFLDQLAEVADACLEAAANSPRKAGDPVVSEEM